MPKCSECERPLFCNHCGRKFTLDSQKAFQAYYDRLDPVVCPACDHILVCRYCGHVYVPDDYDSTADSRQ